MNKVTIKEIRRWMKTLEENRYRKIVNADARRVAWLVNHNLAEDYDMMPKTIRKKWPQAQYGKERYLAKKFMESKKAKLKENVKQKLKKVIKETMMELIEQKQIKFIIPAKDRKETERVLKKTKLKLGKDYSFSQNKGGKFDLNINRSFRNKFLELAIINNIGVRG